MPRAVARPAIQPRGLSKAEAAAYVGLSINAFDRCVANGELPRPRRFPSVAKQLWDRAALDRVYDDSPDQTLSYTVDGETAMLRAIEDGTGTVSEDTPQRGRRR